MEFTFVIALAIGVAFLLRNIESTPKQVSENKSSWLEYQLAKDESEDSTADYIANSRYRRAISQEAIERYFWWDNISTAGDIFVMGSGMIIIGSRNHKEVFGDKSFEELVEEKVSELKLQHRTPEQIEQHDKDRERYFLMKYGLEPNEDKISN